MKHLLRLFAPILLLIALSCSTDEPSRVDKPTASTEGTGARPGGNDTPDSPATPDEPSSPSTPGDNPSDIPPDTPDLPPQNSMKMTITVGINAMSATLVDNSSTRALLERLDSGPLTLTLADYGDMEKVGSLGFKLPRNDQPTTVGPGDIILYQGNSLTIYYDTNSWDFTLLGHIDGVTTRTQMLALLGGPGVIQATLSRIN